VSILSGEDREEIAKRNVMGRIILVALVLVMIGVLFARVD
jgi:hypothetical protein